MPPKSDDLGAQAVAQELGGLPVIEDPPCRRVRCAWSAPRLHRPGRRAGRHGFVTPHGVRTPHRRTDAEASDTGATPPTLAPIITAGSNDPQCVNDP